MEVFMEISKLNVYKEIPIENYKNETKHHEEKHRLEQIHNEIIKKNSFFGENIKFSYLIDEATGKIKIKIYNFQTGETIQEIPSEKFLKFIKELKSGIDSEVLKRMEFLPAGIFFSENR